MWLFCRPHGGVELAICIPAHGAALGAWVGAWPMPLDWERPWQVRICPNLRSALPVCLSCFLRICVQVWWKKQEFVSKWFETGVEQEWPVCCTYGAGGGYLLGLVVTVVLCFVNVRNVRPKQDWCLHTVGYFWEPYICHFGSWVSCSFNYSQEFSFLQFLCSFQHSFVLLEQFRLYCTNLVWQLMIEWRAIMQESPVDSSLFCDYKEVIALLLVLQAVWREKLCGQLAESWTMIMSCSHWQYRGWKATHLEANQKEAC